MSLVTLVQHLEECPLDLEAVDYDHERELRGDEIDPRELAVVLVAIRDCRANLATFADRVERDLLALMGEKKLVVEGIGEIEAKKSTRRTKWQNHDLYVRVVSRALDKRKLDQETSEYESEGSAVARVLEACARPSWRLKPLRALGLDPDEWCEVDEGAWSVRLPPRAIR